MRLRISHETSYHYSTPPAAVTQIVRLTPRNHEGQYVVRWRLELSADCQLHEHEDAFGNITHTFTTEGPLEKLTVNVEGEVDTQDTHGIVRNAVERFPPTLFLRETDLTQPDDAIRAFSDDVRGNASAPQLDLLHALLRALNDEIKFDPKPTMTSTTAAQAFAIKRGVCQDLTHIFIAASRYLGIPARYVGGYFLRADGVVDQEAGHAWAEAFIPDLGWVAFDPTNGISATDAHVRVATGLDYLGASPVRGTRFGGGGESLAVNVAVAQARGQIQDQSQN